VTGPVTPGSGATLGTWLDWIEATHPDEIELGLTRAAAVADRLKLKPLSIPVITVAGTNGKGSTVAMLDKIYSDAGFKTGVYTSPHIVDFNERVSIAGRHADDQTLIAAFEAVESVRHDTALTYFEYSTLAAVHAFVSAEVDVIILEVGLGGRLDTTNVWDTDCAIVTSIAIDHESWLGSDRDTIGREKIGIGRAGRPLIMADDNPPTGVIKAVLDAKMELQSVPTPLTDTLALSLPGAHQQRNAAAALMAVKNLSSRLPIDAASAKHSLSTVQLAGRFEQHRIDGVSVVLDVAHNPAAAASVVSGFHERFPEAPVYCVFGALSDKDVPGILEALSAVVRHWHCVTLEGPRGRAAERLSDEIRQLGSSAEAHNSLADAWKAACEQASAYNCSHPLPEAVVLVAGSFFTLTALHDHWQDVSRIS